MGTGIENPVGDDLFDNLDLKRYFIIILFLNCFKINHAI